MPLFTFHVVIAGWFVIVVVFILPVPNGVSFFSRSIPEKTLTRQILQPNIYKPNKFKQVAFGFLSVMRRSIWSFNIPFPPLPPLKTYELLKNGSFIFASFGAKIVFKCSTQLPGLIVNVPFCKGQDWQSWSSFRSFLLSHLLTKVNFLPSNTFILKDKETVRI